MARKTRILLLALVVIVVLVNVSLIVLSTSRPLARPPLPNPNGYDDFVNAGEAVTGNVGDFPELGHDSLAALVSSNAVPLRLLRVGLTRQPAWVIRPGCCRQRDAQPGASRRRWPSAGMTLWPKHEDRLRLSRLSGGLVGAERAIVAATD